MEGYNSSLEEEEEKKCKRRSLFLWLGGGKRTVREGIGGQPVKFKFSFNNFHDFLVSTPPRLSPKAQFIR